MKIESMVYITRLILPTIQAALDRGKSVLLLGPRQTGKTTLLNQLQVSYTLSFIQPAVRQRYEQNPSLFTQEIEALAEQRKGLVVVVDEVQKVPDIMDVVQDLIDRHIAQFILTGSSARKLRSGARVNLLPGRVVPLRLNPLNIQELSAYPLNLEELLLYGSLPGIFLTDINKREEDLNAYVTTYLEEEIRSEAVVRNIAAFSQFLNLAASESGNIINLSKLSQEIGVSHTTISSYYQILEDCLIAERIDPYTHTKTRRKLIKSSKYLFFDMGVRRVLAGAGTKLPVTYLGRLFEEWVGLELLRYINLKNQHIKLHFWRDAHGTEVDWIIKSEENLIPIEVKWTDSPSLNDAKYLHIFKEEYGSKMAYIVCRTPRKLKLAEGIYALPWQEVGNVFESLGYQ